MSRDGRRKDERRGGQTRFQWGKIELVVLWGWRVGQVRIRPEPKAGKTRSGYITACKCGRQEHRGRGERGEGEMAQELGRDRARTSIAIRKSGIRSRNIEKRVDIPRERERKRYQESKDREKKRREERIEKGKRSRTRRMRAERCARRRCDSRRNEDEREGETNGGEETATFSFRGRTRRMSPSPAITGVARIHNGTPPDRGGCRKRAVEGADRSTSCATVYNAGNTICRNLLPLDTRSSSSSPFSPDWYGISFLDGTPSGAACAHRVCRFALGFSTDA